MLSQRLTGKKKEEKNKKRQKKKVENIAYYKIPVDFEIKGNFLGYIKFKRQLSLSQKMLNFDKESIKVIQGDSTGAIKVNGTLTIVGLADDFFKNLIYISSVFYSQYQLRMQTIIIQKKILLRKQKK